MKLIDIILISALAVLSAVAVISIIIRRRSGKSCSCSCENCQFKCNKK